MQDRVTCDGVGVVGGGGRETHPSNTKAPSMLKGAFWREWYTWAVVHGRYLFHLPCVRLGSVKSAAAMRLSYADGFPHTLCNMIFFVVFILLIMYSRDVYLRF